MRTSLFYYMDGSTSAELNRDKVLHRVDGPALIESSNGRPWFEQYYQNGKLFRMDGPAVIHYSYGDRRTEHYLIGKHLCDNKEDFYRLVEEIKSMEEGLKLIDPRAWVRELA